MDVLFINIGGKTDALAALGATQADLDAAVMENEQGFGGYLGSGAVGFNPLATGFNPNASAGFSGGSNFVQI